MSNQAPKLPKRRTPPWILAGIVLALMAVLILLQSSNIWKNLGVETASDTLTLYALSTLNFIAFVVFAFILLRSLLKLSRERRSFQLGAKIKTRLLAYFVALSILPIIAMFAFSYLFMNRALERWFSQIPENVVRAVGNVQKNRLGETARMIASALENQAPDNQMLSTLAMEGNLTHIEVVSDGGEVLARSIAEIDESRRAEVQNALEMIRSGRQSDPSLSDGKGIDAAVAGLSGGRKLVLIPDLSPEISVAQTVDSSLAEFDRLKDEQLTIRQLGISTLGILTFLLIFAASWTAFYVARGITSPIKALAEGSDEIAKGNFSHRVKVLAEDELALLVDAFNQMSAKLEENSAEIRERRRYIETVLQSLSAGVISFNAEGLITTINKAAVGILRLEDGSFENFHMSELLGRENLDILEKVLNRAKRIGTASEQAVLIREQSDGGGESGESIPVALAAAALPDKSGVVLVVEDLTELIHAQRATAWQEVARRMAHEIKNPLTPIQLSAERIAKRFATANGDAEKPLENLNSKLLKEGTDTILREVSSLKAMVDEFSKFARLPNVKLEMGSLNEALARAASLYQDRGVEIESSIDPRLPNILIDEEQIKRVFINLIENSFEAFDEGQHGRKIWISTKADHASGDIIAEIADNGHGIPQQNLAKLFQPYFSTKGRGTGLGLAIVQRIIIEHGGKIRASANLPKGARFIIELPLTL